MLSCRDLWWRKRHPGNDCQEMTVGDQGLKRRHPRTRIREVLRAIWDSLVGVGGEKTGGGSEELRGQRR